MKACASECNANLLEISPIVEMTSSQFFAMCDVGADRCVCPKSGKLVQTSESQVYLSFYSERSQGSSPRSGVKVESGKWKVASQFATFHFQLPLGPFSGLRTLLTPRAKPQKRAPTRDAPTLRKKPRICHSEQSEESQLTFHFNPTSWA